MSEEMTPVHLPERDMEPQARIEAEPLHDVDRHILENAGADPAQHIIGAGALQHGAVHALAPRQMPQYKPSRPRADSTSRGRHN